MIEIILDASQLEVFEACPRKWYYAYARNLVPRRSTSSFDIGSWFHEVLAHYYYLPIHSTAPIPNIDERMRSTIDFASNSALFAKYNINNLDKQKFYRQRIVDYLFRWMSEDEMTESIAIEQGFSHLLYEDDSRRYILEGKIDMVARNKSLGLFVRDHKTQARKDDRWEFNHQVCNYMSFTGANYFEYSYIGLQDKLPPDGMRRQIYKPHEGMLDQWKKEVKVTFDQMYRYLSKPAEMIPGYDILPVFEMGSFPRRRAACDASKYGLCHYHKLCSVPDESKWVPAVFSAYKEKEEKWSAWK